MTATRRFHADLTRDELTILHYVLSGCDPKWGDPLKDTYELGKDEPEDKYAALRTLKEKIARIGWPIDDAEPLVEMHMIEGVKTRDYDPMDTVYALMADMVEWGGEEDGVPDFAAAFWKALKDLGGWVEGEKVFLPGPVCDLLKERYRWQGAPAVAEQPRYAPNAGGRPARRPAPSREWLKLAQSILDTKPVAIEDARDAIRSVLVPRAILRRLVACLNYFIGMNRASWFHLDEGVPDDPAVDLSMRLSKFHHERATTCLERLIAAADIGDDEDLDD